LGGSHSLLFALNISNNEHGGCIARSQTTKIYADVLDGEVPFLRTCSMLERTTSKRRRAAGTRFQRYAPLVSLVLSTTTFALTTLLILPGTTKGSLENFHLITVRSLMLQ